MNIKQDVTGLTSWWTRVMSFPSLSVCWPSAHSSNICSVSGRLAAFQTPTERSHCLLTSHWLISRRWQICVRLVPGSKCTAADSPAPLTQALLKGDVPGSGNSWDYCWYQEWRYRVLMFLWTHVAPEAEGDLQPLKGISKRCWCYSIWMINVVRKIGNVWGI